VCVCVCVCVAAAVCVCTAVCFHMSVTLYMEYSLSSNRCPIASEAHATDSADRKAYSQRLAVSTVRVA